MTRRNYTSALFRGVPPELIDTKVRTQDDADAAVRVVLRYLAFSGAEGLRAVDRRYSRPHAYEYTQTLNGIPVDDQGLFELKFDPSSFDICSFDVSLRVDPGDLPVTLPIPAREAALRAWGAEVADDPQLQAELIYYSDPHNRPLKLVWSVWLDRLNLFAYLDGDGRVVGPRQPEPMHAPTIDERPESCSDPEYFGYARIQHRHYVHGLMHGLPLELLGKRVESDIDVAAVFGVVAQYLGLSGTEAIAQMPNQPPIANPYRYSQTLNGIPVVMDGAALELHVDEHSSELCEIHARLKIDPRDLPATLPISAREAVARAWGADAANRPGLRADLNYIVDDVGRMRLVWTAWSGSPGEQLSFHGYIDGEGRLVEMESITPY